MVGVNPVVADIGPPGERSIGGSVEVLDLEYTDGIVVEYGFESGAQGADLAADDEVLEWCEPRWIDPRQVAGEDDLDLPSFVVIEACFTQKLLDVGPGVGDPVDAKARQVSPTCHDRRCEIAASRTARPATCSRGSKMSQLISPRFR